MSRQHAKVKRLHDQWILEDLGSQNGTLVAGERVSKVGLAGRRNGSPLSEHGPLLTLEVPTPEALDATIVVDPKTMKPPSSS